VLQLEMRFNVGIDFVKVLRKTPMPIAVRPILARLAGSMWAIALILLHASAASAQAWSWTFEKVDESARFTSMAVDKQGNVHIAYTDGSYHVVKYAFGDRQTQHWYTMNVDPNLQNATTRLALDSKGNPHMCYPDWSSIKHAYWDGQRWVIQEISPGGAKEYTCSLAISPDGIPYVTWYQTHGSNNLAYYHVRTAVLKEGAWLAGTIDFDGEAGKWNSTVLDAQGRPFISYSRFPSGELKLAHWNGKSWDISYIDSLSNDTSKVVRGMGNCLRIDSQGNLHISYYGEKDLRYAVQEAGKWIIRKVDDISLSDSWAGYLSSLDLDSSGHPHISYDDGGDLKHAFWDGTKWHTQTIAAGGSDPYRYSSIGIGPNDTVYISYRDPQDGSLMVAVGQPKEATSSSTPPKSFSPKNN